MYVLRIIMYYYYRGATPGPESNEVCNQLERSKEELAALKEQERELDEQYEKMQVCLKNTMESITDQQYPQLIIPLMV